MTDSKPVKNSDEILADNSVKLPNNKAKIPLDAYEPVVWANIIPTFRCTFCQHCDENEDEMILHVLKHVDKRKLDVNVVFDELVAAKNARFPNSKKEIS